MKIATQIDQLNQFRHLELLAHQVVEGFLSGMHKSPFHGFSAEFSEHKVYNTGESTKHIDWKLYAKTDRLYTKRFEEETNMRCHIIIDNSSSMHFPKLSQGQPFYENKIGFSILAAAVVMNLLKRQRDAVGLSLFSNQYEYYAPEKGSERHHRMLLNVLENTLQNPTRQKTTDSVTFLHQIAEKLHRRSMILLFTDMFSSHASPNAEQELFAALQHLKHNKHKVVLFHVMDAKTELHFDYDAAPRRFVDVETGESVALFAENVKELYESKAKAYFEKVALACAQYKIKYFPVSVQDDFEKIITTYLVEKQKFG